MGSAFASAPRCDGLVRTVSGEEINVSDENVVLLNVYDLSPAWLEANQVLQEVLRIGGAFHAGVEVYGREYVYGSDGITYQAPKFHDVHCYRQSVVMGPTHYSAQQVAQAIEWDMKPRWKGQEYDIITNNCCSFARALSLKLVGKRIPEWVDRLAKLAKKSNLEGIVKGVLSIRPISTDTTTSSCWSEEGWRTMSEVSSPSSCVSPVYSNRLLDNPCFLSTPSGRKKL